MSMTKLLKIEWRPFCDRVSRGLVDAEAEVEVASLAIGDRVEATWLRLYGVVYDPRADVVEIVLEGVDHMIGRPRDIYVESTDRGVVALEIVGEDETRQIVKLREPLRVPSARSRRTGGRQTKSNEV